MCSHHGLLLWCLKGGMRLQARRVHVPFAQTGIVTMSDGADRCVRGFLKVRKSVRALRAVRTCVRAPVRIPGQIPSDLPGFHERACFPCLQSLASKLVQAIEQMSGSQRTSRSNPGLLGQMGWQWINGQWRWTCWWWVRKCFERQTPMPAHPLTAGTESDVVAGFNCRLADGRLY